LLLSSAEARVSLGADTCKSRAFSRVPDMPLSQAPLPLGISYGSNHFGIERFRTAFGPFCSQSRAETPADYPRVRLGAMRVRKNELHQIGIAGELALTGSLGALPNMSKPIGFLLGLILHLAVRSRD
jgi:hypothetical protein